MKHIRTNGVTELAHLKVVAVNQVVHVERLEGSKRLDGSTKWSRPSVDVREEEHVVWVDESGLIVDREHDVLRVGALPNEARELQGSHTWREGEFDSADVESKVDGRTELLVQLSLEPDQVLRIGSDDGSTSKMLDDSLLTKLL